MLQAKDVMTRQVITISKNSPILEGLECLVKNNITGIPVVEDDMTLAGILTDKDVLQLFYNLDDIGKKVCDFMTQPAIYFEDNESLMDVCDCLRDHWFRRVPITSGGKVVGIISRHDIIKYILDLKRELTTTADH
jgi:CBS domain-containing protein